MFQLSQIRKNTANTFCKFCKSTANIAEIQPNKNGKQFCNIRKFGGEGAEKARAFALHAVSTLTYRTYTGMRHGLAKVSNILGAPTKWLASGL